MRIVFLGTPDFTLPLLEACARVGELVAIVAQPDRPLGRSSTPRPPPSKVWGSARGLPVHQPLKVKNGALAGLLASHAPEVAVVAAYGRILPQDALDAPRLGCLNVHASLLPELRGAAPIQWAVARGLARTGVTLMQMDAGLDTGDILLQRGLDLAPGETGETLFARLATLGAALLEEGLPLFCAGQLSRTPQDSSQATLAPLLTREDARVDWTRTATEIDRRRRGFTPWPGAATALDGVTLKLHATQVLAERTDRPPGEVVAAQAAGIDVACGKGTVLRILEVQPEGKKRMLASAFLAGKPVPPGALLLASRPSPPSRGRTPC